MDFTDIDNVLLLFKANIALFTELPLYQIWTTVNTTEIDIKYTTSLKLINNIDNTKTVYKLLDYKDFTKQNNYIDIFIDNVNIFDYFI